MGGKTLQLEDRVFGKLIVVDKVANPKIKGKGSYWFCLCECGDWVEARGNDLVSGKRTHCGCKPPKNYVDHTGKRYGKLLVIKREGTVTSGKKKRSTWLCHCDCGTFKVIRGCNLKNGTKSCGCLLSPEKRAEYAKMGQNKACAKDGLTRLFVKEDKYYGPDRGI